MKARIKKTGEVVNIADYAKVTLDRCDSWGNPIELGFDEVEILQDTTSDIDWEQRRYEILKSVLQGFCANSVPFIDQGTSFQQITEWCIEIADILIAELKKGGGNGSH